MTTTVKNVLIADGNRRFCGWLQQKIEAQPNLAYLGSVHDGRTALLEMERLEPDLVILGLILPHLDGFAVMEEAREKGIKTKFLLVTAFNGEEFPKQAVRHGADGFVIKPFQWAVFIEQIEALLDTESLSKTGEKGKTAAETDDMDDLIRLALDDAAVESLIGDRITELGIPAHYKGYRYLKDAIAMVVYDVELLGLVTKVLYPTIANTHQSTAAKVERSMRYAIEAAWSRGDVDVLHKAFGYSVDPERGRPSNSSFVAKIADEIRLQLRAEGMPLI
ncbi:MAG: sporulation transcription factor Spo0A [Firmicutes bacterium]|nr:sporulation transcription factor Spo0A [Bacillota bacterium]